jgi:hypothetical protein
MGVLSQNDSLQRPSAKAILWVKLPDIDPTKVLFVQDKLPDEFIFPPAAIAP